MPSDYLQPEDWKLTVLLGTSYTSAEPSGEFFVWTDVYPEGIRGDMNGDTEADQQDRQLIQQFIADEDASDGVVDGRVELTDFALNFSVFDVNHNSVVDDLDEMLVSEPGNLDGDEDIDLADFTSFQECFSGSNIPYSPLECGLADLDADGDVDQEDFCWFERALAGPLGQ